MGINIDINRLIFGNRWAIDNHKSRASRLISIAQIYQLESMSIDPIRCHRYWSMMHNRWILKIDHHKLSPYRVSIDYRYQSINWYRLIAIDHRFDFIDYECRLDCSIVTGRDRALFTKPRLNSVDIKFTSKPPQWVSRTRGHACKLRQSRNGRCTYINIINIRFFIWLPVWHALPSAAACVTESLPTAPHHFLYAMK